MAVRVLLVSKGLGPGGAERLLVELARGRDPERVELTAAYVLPWKDHLAGELEREGVEAICLSRRSRDAAWPLRLRALVASGDYDVVHAHSPIVAAAVRLAARTVPAGERPQLMSTEHNTWTSHRMPTQLASRLTAGLDDVTIAVTDEVKHSLRGPARRRAVVVAHGIDVDAVAALAAERKAVRAELGIDAETPVVGTVANFRPQKDYPNLLRAVRLLVDRGVDLRVVAVGQGPLERETRAMASSLGLDDTVMFTGFRADATRVMSACDVFVLASGWEGLPVAVMEALALGLPIVATRVGGVAEQLDDVAVLVPRGDPAALADALANVLGDDDRRMALAGASADRAGAFDICRAVHEVTSRYDALAPATLAPVSTSRPARGRAARVVNDGLTVRPLLDRDRAAVIELLGASLGWSDDERYVDLYRWKHEHNPFGPSLGWVAESAEGAIVAVRLFMRWAFRRGHDVLRAVRAVDTATHPDAQGKGLFTALTLHGLDACREDGIAMVFNTPNSQSRPGYLKMGWREVGRLPAAVRPRSLLRLPAIVRARVPAERWSEPLDVGQPVAEWLDAGRWDDLVAGEPQPLATDRALRTRTDAAFASWRYSVPALHYRVVDDGDAAVIVRLRRRGSARELVVAERLGDRRAADRLAGRVVADTAADHAIRLGAPDPLAGFVPLPRSGPILTWRSVTDAGMPPLPNWDLQLRDIELF